MSVESKIAGLKSLVSHKRGRTNLVFGSHNNRTQAPSGKDSNGTGVIENGIDLSRSSGLNRALAFTGMERDSTVAACLICGRPLTQNGGCLRCLADLGFLSGSQEPGGSEIPRRLTLGPLKYDHFEVEVDVDGFPIDSTPSCRYG